MLQILLEQIVAPLAFAQTAKALRLELASPSGRGAPGYWMGGPHLAGELHAHDLA
jgi:hypothetical protein